MSSYVRASSFYVETSSRGRSGTMLCFYALSPGFEASRLVEAASRPHRGRIEASVKAASRRASMLVSMLVSRLVEAF